MKRTEVLKEAHMWVADIAPGAATGVHRHPTPRFVYVIAGAVTLEIERALGFQVAGKGQALQY